EIEIAVRNGEPHHLHRLAEALEVLGQTEGVDLVVGRVPVGAEPFEHVRRMEDGGAVDGQNRLCRGHELAVHPDVELFHEPGSFDGPATIPRRMQRGYRIGAPGETSRWRPRRGA